MKKNYLLTKNLHFTNLIIAINRKKNINVNVRYLEDLSTLACGCVDDGVKQLSICFSVVPPAAENIVVSTIVL